MPAKCPLCHKNTFSASQYSGYYCYKNSGGCGMSSSVFIEESNKLLTFRINSNDFLKKSIRAYAHGLYIPYKSKFSTDLTRLILDLKGSQSCDIDTVKAKAADIIQKDLDIIITPLKNKKIRPTIVTMARSKPDRFWKKYELQFRPAISVALANSNVTLNNSTEKWMLDGVNFIERVVETQTTHLSHVDGIRNNGPAPYPGITNKTCVLHGDVKNKYIILIDDIYTSGINVDEDCIQYLYDKGASNVILYILGVTVKPPNDTAEDKSTA